VIYLVDANVLSEPTKPSPDAKVVNWLAANEASLVVDPIILGELCLGVLSLPRGSRRARLEVWFEALVKTVDCLPWDALVARRWAALVVEMRRKGHTLPVLDAMIAATALEHGLVLATRNTRDFARTGVETVDPFV
jgi:toxin FitB